MNPTYYVLILFLILWILRNEEKKLWLKKHLGKKRTEGKEKMKELAERFIDREVIVYTFNSQITGTIREVTAGALLLESNSTSEAVNLDFIVRIREYPRKKNGKKKAVVVD